MTEPARSQLPRPLVGRGMFFYLRAFRQCLQWALALRFGGSTVKRKLSEARVFALKGFTIKTDRGKLFVTPIGLKQWSRPYKSLHHATTAIARKLAREFTERNENLQQAKEQRP